MSGTDLAVVAPGVDIPGVEVWANGSTGILVRFPNGYGASIIRHASSYGTELAVIHFSGADRETWELVYDTPITDDVLGWLTPEECAAALVAISNLPLRRRAIDA